MNFLKKIYETSGKVYGYLSKFSHWGHAIHHVFLDFDEDKASVIYSPIKYRAMCLSAILLLLDIFTESIKFVYGERSSEIVFDVQGPAANGPNRNALTAFKRIKELCKLAEIDEIGNFFT